MPDDADPPATADRLPIATSASDPAPGLRERNRRTKQRLIRQAARRLFLERGYEATTLREVAEAADVGFGTVFAYASDKAGLLAMVFVEELKALPPLFPADQRAEDGDLLGALVAGLAPLYRFWASIPTLSALVLQQMEFFGANPHMDLIVERRAQAKDELRRWLGREQDAGRIAVHIDTDRAADTLFAIYTSAVREWSAATPADPEAGLVRLSRLMELPVRALEAAAEPRRGKA